MNIQSVIMQLDYTTLVPAALLVVGVYFFFIRKKSHRSRAMSFSSQLMIAGAFPKKATVAPPLIHAVYFFKKAPKLENVKQSCSRLFDYLRWRCSPEYNSVTKTWEFIDCDHNIDDHTAHLTVNSEAEIYDTMDRLSKDDFSSMTGKPLWKFYLIENKSNGLSAIFCQIHHVIGDGISLVVALKKIFDDKSGAPLSFDLSSAKTKAGVKKTAKKGPSAISMLFTLLKSTWRVLTLGMSKFDSDISFTVKNKEDTAMSIATNKFVFFPTLRLSFVKAIKEKAGGTVNDVMLSLTTGAIRRYCQGRGDALPPGLQVRALMPYAFPRSANEMDDPTRCMRNKWSFLSVPLPMDALSVTDRIDQCHATMESIKTSVDAIVQLFLQDHVLSKAPEFLIHKTAFDSIARHSLIFSNVPGPQRTAYFAGEPVVGLQAMFPNLINQVLIISYNGCVFMNMAVDSAIIRDIPALQKAFLDEAIELAQAFGLSTEASVMLAEGSPEGEFAITSSEE
jgi:diacylglycerol O-acyltransferase / wax synthase